MRRNDLFDICLQNLRRRRARTALTVLGVIVGCCAIVIMVSIGVGMKESQEKMLAEMGDLTVITVYPGSGKKAGKLTAESVKQMESIGRTVAVTPKADMNGNFSVRLYAGENRRYVAEYSEITGLNTEAMEPLGYRLLEGGLPGSVPFTVVVGEDFAYSFADSKRPEGQNTISPYVFSEFGDGGLAMDVEASVATKPKPFFDPLKSKLELEVELENGKKITQQLTVAGRMKEDYGKGMETSQGVVLRIQDLNQLLELVRRTAGGKAKPAQYSSVLVKVESIQDVAGVEAQIKQMGFRTSSMESIRKPMEKEAHQKQLMLGGIGAVSLFVAALGITNTMIMSITERTREIGVMKALGCYVRDVRGVFLLEAGCIGLMGGIGGLVISLTISAAMNLISAHGQYAGFVGALQYLLTPGSRMSVVPLWLAGFALVFSVGIGVGSGWYPANRAVQISALEAIRHD